MLLLVERKNAGRAQELEAVIETLGLQANPVNEAHSMILLAADVDDFGDEP
jgi:hypothetical protein